MVSEQAEQGRQKGERGQDREDHRDRRRVAERRHERDSGDDERQERDRDGPAGEQDRSARRGDRAGDRFPDLHPLRNLRAVLGDDEQRVVDPDREPDHRGHGGRCRRHVREVAE